MSEGEVKTGGTMTPSTKGPLVIAAAGVLGFCVGWGLGMAVNPDLRLFLGVVGLVGGASVGWLIGRLGNKTTA